ncbi:MAG: thiol peroxidase [Deltaproteobacteria bacterium]|nr:thiol peroxidase [Deltaproteobacteria bacterium]
MQERDGIVTMKGNPITLMGTELQVGDKAPDFVAIDNDLNPVSFDSFRGKVCIVSSVPSLDTPVCDMETRREILTISVDLPFAQKRWCGAAGVDRVQTLSDHRDVAFGQAYGVLIKGFRLLARAVFVVDKEGTIRYIELVKEIASEPDYDSVLTAVKELV